MKLSRHTPAHCRPGYASILATISLAIILIAFSLTTFRETKQAHTVQGVTQVRIDYEQKERAFLRALLHLVPNAAMRTMARDSEDVADSLNWESIFAQALQEANIDRALDPETINELGISASAISANTGDATYVLRNGEDDLTGLITSPNGSGHLVLPSTQGATFPANLDLPPALQWNGIGSATDLIYPVIATNKRLPGENKQFSLLPYPDISFGYRDQDSDFIAKRNWWAFTTNFGANTQAASGIRPNPKTYVLSIYEVPSQLAISSAGFTTSLGKFGDASDSDWDPDRISIQGSIYAKRARIENLNRVGTVSSREGVTLGAAAPGDQTLGSLSEQRRQQASQSINTFVPFSSSADSGLVSFTPINRGTEFFDFFSDSDDNDRISPTGWSDYSLGARNCQMTIDICRVKNNTSEPDRLIVAPIFDVRPGNPNGTVRPLRCTRDASWNRPGDSRINSSDNGWNYIPSGNDWPIQSSDSEVITLPDGRPYVTLDLEKLPEFLDQIGAEDVTVNNSLWIGPRAIDGDNRRYDPRFYSDTNSLNTEKAEFPSTNDDIALIITKSSDLSAYTNGFTLVTPFRVYFADDFNEIPTTPPAGSGITEEWYPPVSIYAPEKRFGIEDTSGQIELTGQIGYLPADENGADIHPLDLRDGGTDNVDPSAITANLTTVDRLEDLPPINNMSWLTTIEEVQEN